jgi:hypothetical protein
MCKWRSQPVFKTQSAFNFGVALRLDGNRSGDQRLSSQCTSTSDES